MKNKAGTPKIIIVNIKKLAKAGICNNLLSKIIPVKAANANVLKIVKNLLGRFFAASNSLPSLVKNIVSLTKVVLEKYFTNNGTPKIVNQDVMKLRFLSFKNEVNCQPHILRIQNTKFHNLSLLSHFSVLGWSKRLLLASNCLVEFCITHSCFYVNSHHNTIPKIRSIIKQIIITLAIIIHLVPFNTAYAETREELLDMIALVEKEHNIPTGLLLAVAKIESSLEAYALNISGRSIVSKDKNAALKNIQRALDEGVTNIDIGAAQINYKWHGHKFSSIEDMISPKVNIQYAAKLLSALKQEYGDWHKAIRHYHSSKPKHHRQYSRKVVLCWLST